MKKFLDNLALAILGSLGGAFLGLSIIALHCVLTLKEGILFCVTIIIIWAVWRICNTPIERED